MLQAFFKPLHLIAAVLWGIGLYTLINLGVWQVQRLEWKNDLEQQLQAQSTIKTSQYPALADITPSIHDKKQHIYRALKVEIQSADMVNSIFVGPRIHEEIRGYHLYTPFKMKNNLIVYAHLGWVSSEYKEAFQAQSSFNTLTTSVEAYGYISSPPRQSRFGSTNAPSRNIWTQVDLAAFFKHHDFQDDSALLPYIFVPAEKTLNTLAPLKWFETQLPESQKHYAPPKSLAEIELRNNHFQYLLFWFAMALIWGGFGAYGAYRIIKQAK